MEAILVSEVDFKPTWWLIRKHYVVEYKMLPHLCFFFGLLSHIGSKRGNQRISGWRLKVRDDLIYVHKRNWVGN